ncbi:MAG: serine/threonine-protein kinase [Planctomyces sp.]|jgi:serine/threonine protein kinase
MTDECLSTKQLQAYASGELGEEDVPEVEGHLLECCDCRGSLDGVLFASQPIPASPAFPPASFGMLISAESVRRELLDVAVSGNQSTRTVRSETIDGPPPGSLPVRYMPVRRLGTGGMGEVWEIYDSVLGRPLAVKFLRAGDTSLQHLQRLLREAVVLGRLGHPGVVRVYEVLTETVAPAVIMELVPGPSLKTFMAGKVTSERSAAIFISELCDAVQHAHSHGVVHRDLKPSNILLRNKSGSLDDAAVGNLSAWQPVLTDFGTARIADDHGMTLVGQLIGTPAYMAPEQAKGEAVEITEAVDIYGLGVILYELLAGRPPFLADSTVAMLDLVRQGDPPSPQVVRPDLSRDLVSVCLKCLSLAPGDRYRSASLLREDLQAFLESRPVKARRLSWSQQLFRWYRRNRQRAWLLGTIVVTIVAITCESIYFGISQQALQIRATQMEQAAVKSRRASEARTVQVEQTLRSAIGVAGQALQSIDARASADPLWRQEREKIGQEALAVFEQYLNHFSAAGSIPVEHFWIACQTCNLKWQVAPGRFQEAELERIEDSWRALPESVREVEEYHELRASVYATETEYYRGRADHRRAAAAFLNWAGFLQQRAMRYPDGSPARLHNLRIGSGMLQNCCVEWQADKQFREAACAAEAGVGIMDTVLKTVSDDDRDLLNYLVLSKLAAENWHSAGETESAVKCAKLGLLKYSTLPVRESWAEPVAEQFREQLEHILKIQRNP